MYVHPNRLAPISTIIWAGTTLHFTTKRQSVTSEAPMSKQTTFTNGSRFCVVAVVETFNYLCGNRGRGGDKNAVRNRVQELKDCPAKFRKMLRAVGVTTPRGSSLRITLCIS